MKNTFTFCGMTYIEGIAACMRCKSKRTAIMVKENVPIPSIIGTATIYVPMCLDCGIRGGRFGSPKSAKNWWDAEVVG